MRTGRVRTRAEFAALATGRRSRRRAIQVTVDLGGDTPRVAFAINRRVGGAVVRNRLRRRLRALLDHADLPGGTYLVVATPAATLLDHAALRAELEACLADVLPADTADRR